MAAKTAEIKNKPMYTLLSVAKTANLLTVHNLIKKGKTPDIKIQINK